MTIDVSKAREWLARHEGLTGLEALAVALQEKEELARDLAAADRVIRVALRRSLRETFDPQAVRELLEAIHVANANCPGRVWQLAERVHESEKK